MDQISVQINIYLFRAFDHSHALLGTGATAKDSLAMLASDHVVVERHPFFGLVNLDVLVEWVARIEAVPDDMITECCVFRRDFRSVTQAMQSELAAALNTRKRLLPSIVRAYSTEIATFQAKEEG